MSKDLLVDSLIRRMKAVTILYERATASMTVDQVNYVERDNVLPIAFSLYHIVNMIDFSLAVVSQTQMVINDELKSRMKISIDDHGKERTTDEMTNQRIGNYEAFIIYMNQVFGKTLAYLETLTVEELEKVIVPKPYPSTVANTYSALVGGEEGITKLDAIESWIYQHALRHMGEIEHARALVGLKGMTS